MRYEVCVNECELLWSQSVGSWPLLSSHPVLLVCLLRHALLSGSNHCLDQITNTEL